MEISKNILISSILAIGGLLTWVAYKYPKAFKNIFYVIIAPLLLFWTSHTTLTLSYLDSRTSLLRQSLEDSPQETLQDNAPLINTIDENKSSLKTAFIFCFPISLYMYFLYFLPEILKMNKKEAKKELA